MTEYFETYDDDGRPAGLVPRDVVHTSGLWHRSAHVFLFNDAGELLIQRRAHDKDLYPDRWDFSVGEHLQPGESYLDGALRGLHEELGVSGVALFPLLEVRRATFALPELGVVDRELQQSFRGEYSGAIAPDPTEVAAVEWIGMEALAHRVQRAPETFTPWFLSEVETLRLLPGPAPSAGDAAAQNRPS